MAEVDTLGGHGREPGRHCMLYIGWARPARICVAKGRLGTVTEVFTRGGYGREAGRQGLS